mgnify:CR=1 FL=1
MIDYTAIAQDFDKTRGYVWPCVKRFLEGNNHRTGSSVLEAGCGNGRTGVMSFMPSGNVASVNCYGVKPGQNDYPSGTIFPFNQSKWSSS